MKDLSEKYRVREDRPYYPGYSNETYSSDNDFGNSLSGRYHSSNNKQEEEPEFAPPPRTPGYATAKNNEKSWPKKKISGREVIFIILGCVLLLALAVGTAVGIILTQQGYFKTVSATTTPSIITTTTAYITYRGLLKLVQPWPGSFESLKTNFTSEIDQVIKNSSLNDYFISSYLDYYSEFDNTLQFHLDFSNNLRDYPVPTGAAGVDQQVIIIEDIIKQGETTLAINTSSVIIIGHIITTTPSISTTSSTDVFSTPTLTESQSSTDPSSSTDPPSLTEPPSTTEPPSSTESPSSTELPSSTTVTSSPPTKEISTTTELSTSTPISTPDPKRCEYQHYELCKQFGNTFTLLPNFFFDDTIESAIQTFQLYFNSTIESSCSRDSLFFFCNFVFPQCDEIEERPFAIYPCESVCNAVTVSCAANLPFPLDCNYPGSNSSQCVTPPPVVTTPAPKICHEVDFTFCSDLGFNMTSLPTLFADDVAGTETAFNTYALATVATRCSKYAQFFYCGLFFPRCESGNQILPCRSVCEDIDTACSDVWIFPVDCEIFSNDTNNCLLPPSEETTTIVPDPPTTTTPPLGERCVPNTVELCQSFGIFNLSFYPNQWQIDREHMSLETYGNFGAIPVASGCSNGTLFYLCSVLFPPCEDERSFSKPCTDFCKEINRDCKNILFNQPCDAFSDNSATCLRPPPMKECSSGEFSCHGSLECIPSSNVCDGYGDCTDWSDEHNCVCNEYQYQCGMGMCIKNYQRCDKNVDCPDHSDEVNCTCPQGQFTCDNGQCIMPEWVCDRQFDCSNNEDELNCPECTNGEFRCLSGECLLASKRCDGIPQCKDLSDEKQCIVEVSKTDPFLLQFNKTIGWLPVCAENFSLELADITCQKFGHIAAVNWSAVDYEYYMYAHMNPNGDTVSVIGKTFIRSFCSINKAVMVQCEPKGCGQRKANSVVNFIVNGHDAAPGNWPWQVSIQRVGKHYCGGSLISPNFIVTAAHCIDTYQYAFEFIDIVLGATKLSAKEIMQVTRKIKRLVIHNHIYHERNDIALIQLSMPVNYTDYIQPICLPEKNEVFSRSDLCYAVGWGMKAWNTTFSNRLQEAKMTLWDISKCNSSLAWNGAVGDTFMCAGYYSGFISTCSGDSGGSLVCQGNDYHWKLVGISSYVATGCNIPERPMVFSDAKYFTPWIYNHTECIFTCDNGNCIYDQQQLCNRKNDCGDKSDEILPCSVSVNCTFDEPFLCGYDVSWDRISSTDFTNHYALYDHTVGTYPGHFMVGRKRGILLTTPRFNATTNMCLRFYYHMRGDIIGGIQVWFHQYSADGSNTWEPVYKKKEDFLPDRWITGNINMKDGQFQVVFVANVGGRVAIDDVQLLEQPCATAGCSQDQISCGSGIDKQCLDIGARCNLVADCMTGEDELNCAETAYFCDFDRPQLCGLQQDTTDNDHAEWRVVNASKTPNAFTDHSSGLGNMLMMETRVLLENKEVRMTQDLHLGGEQHCLSFYYYSNTKGTLQISYTEPNSTITNIIWTTSDRITSSWSKTQIDLPGITNISLTYTMIGGRYDGTYRPFIALDDLNITRGQCGQFECEGGDIPCVDENYCLARTSFCDRKVDCAGGSDEAACKCTENEYKCPGGQCIDKSLTCNREEDCVDGSDEGAICDYLNSVTCDFENEYACGYQLQSTEYTWTRYYGSTNTGGTGPDTDHTYNNKSGHYLYADGSDGRYAAITYAESPSFNSTGKSLKFYYHIFSMFADFYTNLGTLMLTVKDRELRQNYTLLVEVASTSRKWRHACVDLPVSSSISLMFVAQRGNQTQADIAIDDIKLLNGRCIDNANTLEPVSVTDSTSKFPITTPQTLCETGYRACRNGMCIEGRLWCDSLKDCLDNSDEMACP